MKISIVLPVYNVVHFIEETIQSVIKQSYDNWELLIVDDCSTDGTYEYLIKVYSNDSRICIFRNKQNLGVGLSRNVGLKNATGRFVSFLDSDDLWVDEKLVRQINFMLTNQASICHTSYSFISEVGTDRIGCVNVSKKVDLMCLLKNTEIGTSTVMLDTHLIGKSVKFPSARTRQDLMLWIELLAKGHESYGLDEVLTKYRLRRGQISRNKLRMVFITFKVYMSIPYFAPWQRFVFFQYYLFNAVLKRFQKRE